MIRSLRVPLAYSKFEASLGYIRPCLQNPKHLWGVEQEDGRGAVKSLLSSGHDKTLNSQWLSLLPQNFSIGGPTPSWGLKWKLMATGEGRIIFLLGAMVTGICPCSSGGTTLMSIWDSVGYVFLRRGTVWGDDSADTGPYCLAWWLKFKPQDLFSLRREPTPTNCPLTPRPPTYTHNKEKWMLKIKIKEDMKLGGRCMDRKFRELEVEWGMYMIKKYGMCEIIKE